jgi:mono/diheme cytochrome c family protein
MTGKNKYILCTAALIITTLWLSDSSRVTLAAVGPGGEQLTDLGPTTGTAAEGRKLWLRLNCAGCHGAHDEGGMAPSIRDKAGSVSGAVLSGRTAGMPSYKGRVTTTDINRLVAYLRSLCNPDPTCTGEPRFTHWWESPPTQ